MSSILKALKKLDEEAPKIENSVAWPIRVDTRRTIVDRVRRQWFSRRITVIVVGVVLTVFAGWGVMRQQPFFTPRVSQPLPTSATAVRPQRPVPVRTLSSPLQDSIAPSVDQETGPVADAGLQAQGGSVTPDSKQRIPIAPPAAKDSPPPADESIYISPSSTDHPPADSSKLALQALVWSEVSKDRFAVINGRIVKEGQSVDGYLVTEIRWDTVLLESGGVTSSLGHNQGN